MRPPNLSPSYCPMPLGEIYDPLGTHAADPYPFYARTREEAPVFFSPTIDAWMVSRRADAVAVLKDHRRFGAATAHHRTRSQYSPEVLAVFSQILIRDAGIISVDPPEHTRLRRLANSALSRGRILGLEPHIRRFSDRLIDQFEPHGRADFVAQFAHPFPVMVIGKLLDLPETEFEPLRQWSEDLMALVAVDLPPEPQLRCAQSLLAFQRYLLALAEARCRDPGADLVGDLVRAGAAEDGPLTPGEVAAMLQIVIVAGFETTIRLVSSCLCKVLAERRHWRALVAAPGGIPAVVEEALRFDGPVLTIMRKAREDVELGGQTIPKGALVGVLVGSANHDEAVFANPETFDAARERTSAHLAFGHGVHFCLGASLARLETRIGMEQLARRMPSLRLVPDQRVAYAGSTMLRGPERLLVEWEDRLQ